MLKKPHFLRNAIHFCEVMMMMMINLKEKKKPKQKNTISKFKIFFITIQCYIVGSFRYVNDFALLSICIYYYIYILL